MSRILFIIAIVGIALWWLFGRRRDDAAKPEAPTRKSAVPQAMVACAHCGVHLPQNEAVCDALGHPFCGEAHRLAGPR